VGGSSSTENSSKCALAGVPTSFISESTLPNRRGVELGSAFCGGGGGGGWGVCEGVDGLGVISLNCLEKKAPASQTTLRGWKL
jgi:hypothetical protein